MKLKLLGTAVWVLAAMASGAQKKIELPVKYRHFDMEAHRGGKGLMPENTIPAMLHAIDMGVTTLEMDMQVTRDGQIVVSHDATFNYGFTTTPAGDTLTPEASKKRILYTMTYDSIKKYDVGKKFYAAVPRQQKMAVVKPLLKDLLKATEAYAKKKGVKIQYNIEIKSNPKGEGVYCPPVAEFTDLAMKTILPFKIGKRMIIQCFDERALKIMHEKYPQVQTSLLIGDKEKRSLDEQLKSLGYTPEYYSPHYSIVTPELVKACHLHKMKIVPWTVDDIENIKKLADMGADGLITDYPDLFYLLK
ncbi:glycerophosphodiester phosphodiesterase family protein [Niabella drilacis]|uniref:Glycerophosphoryl diester phosphodiesterase n=1 Tax=Niabella drilacis (strain DSM 25811 / CCM 8410 / CCUG 62505 / LMG 26954 / E90) TaxID=1285928 RepID=A0A1G6XBF2_NIADE|nr:glycerophosphodiester phosphodiesterase family protein [Niabella drilacis]SDD75488.1 glycerophosphoryl diester phosphodiesterase [Niabella drilacis]